MQVSNVESPNVNGKLQLLHPVGVGYVGGSVVADQTARNPVPVVQQSVDLNVTLRLLVMEMMVQGSDICPQCLEM